VQIGRETHRVDAGRGGDPHGWCRQGGRPTCLVQIGRETHRVDAGRRETHMFGADREGDPQGRCR